MKVFRTVTLFLLILFLCSLNSFAALPDDKMERHVLDSGLVVITSEKHDTPLVAIHIWVRCGSIYETPQTRGISHFYEHMIFRGTNEVRVGEINRTIEKWGGTVNAVTSKDYTQYYFVVDKKYALSGLKLMAEGVMNTEFNPDELNVERNIVLEELYRTVNNPQNYISDLFDQTLMEKNPYKWPIIGYEDTIKSINRDQFIQYQNSYYRPNNMCVVIVGDFETKKMLEDVKQIFSGFKNAEVPPLDIHLDKSFLEPKRVLEDKGMPQATLIFGYEGPGVLENPEDVYVVDIIAFLLGQGQSSRFNRELKEEKKLVDGIEVAYYTSRFPSPFFVWAILDKGNIRKVEKELVLQFKRLIEEPVSEEELKRAKILLESTFIFGNETVDGLGGTYGFYEIVADNVNFSKTYIGNIKKVTQQDIMRVASKYFGSGNYTMVVLK